MLPSFIFDNFWFQPPKTIIRSTYLSGEAWSILNFPLKSVGVSIENPFKLHVFFAHKHSKFWSIFLGQKVERNPLFSEECQNRSGFLRYVIRSFHEIISFFHFRINYTRDVRDRIMYVHVNSSWKYILYIYIIIWTLICLYVFFCGIAKNLRKCECAAEVMVWLCTQQKFQTWNFVAKLIQLLQKMLRFDLVIKFHTIFYLLTKIPNSLI